MAERDPIDLFKEQLNRMDELAGIHPDEEAFKQWYSETKTLLEKAFGSKSVHYQNFLALRFREITVKSFASPEIDRINAGRFKRDLETAKAILSGGIKELTLDRTLFRKIPSTPRTVAVSIRGECFLSSGSWEPETIQAVEKALEGLDLKLAVPENDASKGDWLHQRIDRIRHARTGVYHLSVSEMSSVLMELGAAIALGKEVIIILRKGSPIPETLRDLDPIEYENAGDLTEKLKKKVSR